MFGASSPAPCEQPRPRRYCTAALFRELDGRTFHRFDDLVEAVLDRVNRHLAEFPIDHGYREAIALAERRGWLAIADDGRRVTVKWSGDRDAADVAALAA